jgi:hypothetical protein
MTSIATIFVTTNARADSNSLIDTTVILELSPTTIGISIIENCPAHQQFVDALPTEVKMSEHRLLVKISKVNVIAVLNLEVQCTLYILPLLLYSV